MNLSDEEMILNVLDGKVFGMARHICPIIKMYWKQICPLIELNERINGGWKVYKWTDGKWTRYETDR